MKVLEFFSGFGSISKAFRAKGHETFEIDWDKRFDADMHCDISTLKVEDLPIEWRHPDVIFLGFDCTSYSVAAISKHRRKNKETGNLDPISEKAIFSDNMAAHCRELIKEMNPKIQIWENPCGGMRKMWFVQDLIRNETTYCKWGFTYRKATDFFSNIDLHLKPPCKNGDSCHEKASRGARTGLQAIKDPALKAIYPPKLCEHIVEECERYLNEEEN